MISIKNLSKSYGKKEVLSDINAQFINGKIYGIVGENGAGKTTLFRCLIGLEKFKGSIDSKHTVLKDVIAYLATNSYFMTKITGREYLQLHINARQIKNTDFDAKNIFDLPLDQYCGEYSTGMKKKLALLAILLQENEIYVLDEPFNGVDIHSNLIISEIILELKRLGKTIILSSHIFSSLSKLCDEIFMLKDGTFTQKVKSDSFFKLEQEMKEVSIGSNIEKLNLK